MTRLNHFRASIRCGLAVALLGLPASAEAQTPLLEVEKGSNKLVQVNDDGGVLARGISDGFGVIPASGPGIRMMWYPAKSAFRAGIVEGDYWDAAKIGSGSMAGGLNTTASGLMSTAFGVSTIASGNYSTAAGSLSSASGEGSVALGLLTKGTGQAAIALGDRTTASGNNSTALGELSVASGLTATAIGSDVSSSGFASFATGSGTKALGRSSTALGENTTAAGDNSIATGKFAAAFGGSFAFGDASTNAVITALVNQFVARASGGFRFRTSSNLSTGCDLETGSGTFNCTSSRLAKEGFHDIHGELVLEKLSTIPIQRWRYRGTDQWHVGPTAEDFHGAFQLGSGPTTISTVDADGISLLAVQALERRTAELMKQNAALEAQLEELRRIVMENRRVP